LPSATTTVSDSELAILGAITYPWF
jgi:hypothetical protein